MAAVRRRPPTARWAVGPRHRRAGGGVPSGLGVVHDARDALLPTGDHRRPRCTRTRRAARGRRRRQARPNLALGRDRVPSRHRVVGIDPSAVLRHPGRGVAGGSSWDPLVERTLVRSRGLRRWCITVAPAQHSNRGRFVARPPRWPGKLRRPSAGTGRGGLADVGRAPTAVRRALGAGGVGLAARHRCDRRRWCGRRCVRTTSTHPVTARARAGLLPARACARTEQLLRRDWSVLPVHHAGHRVRDRRCTQHHRTRSSMGRRRSGRRNDR